MCSILKVQWTITPKTAPRPFMPCSGCGLYRAFQCSGKVRLNANGRKLDAWLIYKCVTCDKTWNRPLFERQTVRSLSPELLACLQTSDPDWVRAESFRLDALRRHAQRIEEADLFDVQKTVLEAPAGWTRLDIVLQVPFPADIRLDRLLASELPLSRSQLQRMQDQGRLRTDAGLAHDFRRRIKHGMRISLALVSEAEQQAIGNAAMNNGP